MEQFKSLEEITHQNTWMTIGVFDGVHLGHQKIMRRLVEGAHENKSTAVVVTFDPHPAEVLGGIKDFKYLTPPKERFQILESLGVDITVTLTFTHTFANQTAEEFMQAITHPMGLTHLLIGYDTALGKDRLGNADKLTEIGKRLGFEVEVVSPVTDQGGIISSTRIRKMIASGQVTQATNALGRNYSVEGPVIHGDGRGRQLNFPTANVMVPLNKSIPANGIYASWAFVEGERYPAATSIGLRPTFGLNEMNIHVEAYLLDFQGDLYEREIKLDFVEFLRSEQKFASVESLIEQMQKDVGQTRTLLRQS